MNQTEKYARNIERFRQAVFAHDRENECVAWGIGLSRFDMDRLGFDEAELLWSEPTKITAHADDGVTGNFRVLCNGGHGLRADAAITADGVTTKELVEAGGR